MGVADKAVPLRAGPRVRSVTGYAPCPGPPGPVRRSCAFKGPAHPCTVFKVPLVYVPSVILFKNNMSWAVFLLSWCGENRPPALDAASVS